MSVRINPSILAADFANLEAEINRASGGDLMHVDVMDNHFVPNLTLGRPVVESLQRVSPIPLDLHLMITDADKWAPIYAETGAFSVTFHAEATADPVSVARRLRSMGTRAGLAVKPGTSIEPYCELLVEFDQLLIMTVEPGFGGQSFLADTMPKLQQASKAVLASGLDIWLQVDGGINEDTIEIAAKAGANTFVAGSSVFGAENAANQISILRELAERHRH